jgi:hypothetical protein
MKRWVIKDRAQDLFWSNDWGWTSLAEATVFDHFEHGMCCLPLGGRWVKHA